MSETGEFPVNPIGDENDALETDALLSRLRLIEDQPLESRAAAFAQVHDQLQARLDAGDSQRTNG